MLSSDHLVMRSVTLMPWPPSTARRSPCLRPKRSPSIVTAPPRSTQGAGRRRVTSAGVTTGGGGAVYNLKALGPSSQFKVTNCILWDDSTNEIAVGGSGGLPTVSYSDVDQDGYAGSNGNIRQSPGFGANHHLAAGSPCIDLGSNAAPSLPAKDIDGDARILDGDENGSAVVDMGADEFITGATPGWGAASTVASDLCSKHEICASRALNSLGMLLVPLAAILLYARWMRGN